MNHNEEIECNRAIWQGWDDLVIDERCKRTLHTSWDKYNRPLDIELIETIYDYLSRIYKYKKDMVVLDIGSQGGTITLISKWFPESTWYAFEPVNISYEILNKNLLLNNISNVITYNKAVSNKNEVGYIKIPSDGHLGHPTLGDNPPHFNDWTLQKTDIVRGDDFLNTNIDFIKIDAEGAEIDIIRGLKNHILKYKPTILLEIALGCLQGFGLGINDIFTIIDEIGYHVEWRDCADWETGGNIIISPK